MVPGGALAGTGIVLAAHLLLTELVLVRRVTCRRGRNRCSWAVFLKGIDWFHGRPPQYSIPRSLAVYARIATRP
jgi:hypothetical protein